MDVLIDEFTWFLNYFDCSYQDSLLPRNKIFQIVEADDIRNGFFKIQVVDQGVGLSIKEPHKCDEVLDRLKATESECEHLRTQCQVINYTFVSFIISFLTWNLTTVMCCGFYSYCKSSTAVESSCLIT